MNNRKKLSIIIPFYNVDKYIERCIRSIINQNVEMNSYEIILINDGSSDNSLNIAEKISVEYENIYLFSKLNGGQGSARNLGLSKAKGEYIWMIDSDDWIAPNCLQRLYAELSGIDVLVVGFVLVDDNKQWSLPCLNWKSRELITGICFLKNYFIYPYSGVPFSIVKREIIEQNKLRFYENILFEDNLYTPCLFFFAKTIKYNRSPIYYYYQRFGSSTHKSAFPKQCLDIIIIINKLMSFINENSNSFFEKRIFYRFVSCNAAAYYRIWKEMENPDKKMLVKEFHKSTEIKKAVFLGGRLRHWLLFVLIRYSR